MKTKTNSNTKTAVAKENTDNGLNNKNNDINQPNKVESKASDIVKKSADNSNLSTRERLMVMRMNSVTVKTVGAPEDLIPFVWRHPLILGQSKKMSKKYMALTLEESQRASMVPMPTEE